jgi:hypothetical protein
MRAPHVVCVSVYPDSFWSALINVLVLSCRNHAVNTLMAVCRRHHVFKVTDTIDSMWRLTLSSAKPTALWLYHTSDVPPVWMMVISQLFAVALSEELSGVYQVKTWQPFWR